jgi:serine/threonine-protein kinase
LSALVAATLSLCSAWLGPFVLVPVATATLALMLATRLNPHERVWLVFIWSCAILAPFGVELLHVFPPAYSFQGGDLVLHARALSLPEVPTLVALAYTSLAYLVLPMIVVGRLRDTQRGGDRKLFVQAWYLKQLFPVASASKESGDRTT